MGRYPESEFDIRLNTFTCYLEPTPGERLKSAHNDPFWSAVGKRTRPSDHRATRALRHTPTGQLSAANDSLPRTRLGQINKPNRFIQHWLTANSVDRHLKSLVTAHPNRHVSIVEVGCKLQAFKRFLSNTLKRGVYLGVDQEPRYYPDLVANICNPDDRLRLKALNTDVLISFDLFHSSPLTIVQAKAILVYLSESATQGTRVYFTVPQRLKKTKTYKLSQSHCGNTDTYELSIREWEHLVGEFFTICEVRSMGIFSQQNTQHPKGKTTRKRNESVSIRSLITSLLTFVDLSMTQLFGKLYLYKRCSHSLLFAVELKRL